MFLDSRYISSELLRKVPTTAVYGQVGNDRWKSRGYTTTVIIGLDPIIQKDNNIKYEVLLCLYPRERQNGTLYIGMTNDLIRRVGEHR